MDSSHLNTKAQKLLDLFNNPQTSNVPPGYFSVIEYSKKIGKGRARTQVILQEGVELGIFDKKWCRGANNSFANFYKIVEKRKR